MKLLPTIGNTVIKNQRVVLRTDMNVPIMNGKILDDTRILESIPTIKNLLEHNNALIIISHFGKPKGFDRTLTMQPIANRLKKYLNRDVQVINHLDPQANRGKIELGHVVMLENVRFDKRDENNDASYAKLLASYGDIFVNDAFSVCHRVHASTVGIASLLPHFAGLSLTKEVAVLHSILHKPKRPIVTIVGGGKTKDKIAFVKSQLNHSEWILLGGCVAIAFAKAKSLSIGATTIDNESIATAASLLSQGRNAKARIVLPIDVQVQHRKTGHIRSVRFQEIGANEVILDIGKKTVIYFTDMLVKAKTIIMNGPMGKYEEKPFDFGTHALLRNVSQTSALTIIGGGDTIAAIPYRQTKKNFSHISTGGGAMLQFIERETLPGIEALQK